MKSFKSSKDEREAAVLSAIARTSRHLPYTVEFIYRMTGKSFDRTLEAIDMMDSCNVTAVTAARKVVGK